MNHSKHLNSVNYLPGYFTMENLNQADQMIAQDSDELDDQALEAVSGGTGPMPPSDSRRGAMPQPSRSAGSLPPGMTLSGGMTPSGGIPSTSRRPL